MNPITDAVVWLNDPDNWQGPQGILSLTGQHLWISFLAVLIACAIAWSLGLWLGHTGRGGNAVVVISNASRAIPTLALLTILSSIGAWFFGTPATVISLAVFAIPPLLSNTYVGIRGVDPDVVDAARGMGLSASQTLWRVEVPLAIPLIAAGFRTAAVQVVATTTLAALVGGGGLGNIINLGLGQQKSGVILAGGFLVAVLALATEGILALAQRMLTPGRVRRKTTKPITADPAGAAA
ncbi:ABC transporter permease [Fodinicola feengrottensis]|uniref:ABC transporter permease subunit n=1 Tax=Fodinicola feengrottensis TaxID=435914 RepID=A0ABP4UJD5_9ACTN|nr:ABC transporter permease [Fodinicola feengrottensis]